MRQETLAAVGKQVKKLVNEVCDQRLADCEKRLDECVTRAEELDAGWSKKAEENAKVLSQCVEDIKKFATDLQQVNDQAANYMSAPAVFPPQRRGFRAGRRSGGLHRPSPFAGTDDHALMERGFKEFMRNMMLRDQFY